MKTRTEASQQLGPKRTRDRSEAPVITTVCRASCGRLATHRVVAQALRALVRLLWVQMLMLWLRLCASVRLGETHDRPLRTRRSTGVGEHAAFERRTGVRVANGGGGGGVGQLRSPLTACLCNCALDLGEGGNQEAPSPKLPWLSELRCPRRLAPVGPRKVVKTRPNGRNNSRGKLKGRYYSVKKPGKLVKFQALSYLVLATQRRSLAHTA